MKLSIQPKRLKLILALTGACLLTGTKAFAPNAGFATPARLRSLHMMRSNNDHWIKTSSLAFPMFLASSAPFGSGAASAALTSSDPMVEAELLNDLAHVSLDLVTLLGPATIFIRLSAVVGRLFAMAADYVPDHTVFPEELVFQTFMLLIAWIGLVKSAMPFALSQVASNLSLRDGKAYTSIFQSSGVTWDQYKALSVFALEWVEVPAGRVIASHEEGNSTADTSNNDYVYWLYSGNASVTNKERGELYKISRKGRVGKPSDAAGLWGEESLLQRSKKTSSKGSSKKSAKKAETTISSGLPKTTLRATHEGATLLRFDTNRVQELASSDPALAEALRSLVFEGMQAKLAARFLEEP